MKSHRNGLSRSRGAGLVLAIGLVAVGNAWSQAAEPAKAQGPASGASQPAQEQICGWQMMTPEERQVMQTRMRNAGSEQERDRIRAAHHEQMQARARERGVELNDPPCGRGMGMGPARGPGMGPKSGMGKGPGR